MPYGVATSGEPAARRAGRPHDRERPLSAGNTATMRITRHGHSCLLVEVEDARILMDPGVFSFGFEHLRGLTAVLVTHQHPDHLDVDRLRPLLQANPDARLHVDEGSADQLSDLATLVVHDGDVLDLDASVTVHGSQHAVIHEDIPRIPNVG